MRILFISNPNSPLTRRWIDWFAANGYTVALIADTPVQRPWQGMQIFNLAGQFNRSPWRYFVWTFWLRKIIRQWKPDIVHAHRINVAAWLGWASGFRPLVLTAWGSDLYLAHKQSLLYRWLVNKSLGAAAAVTADAPDLLEVAVKYGAPASVCHWIQWGIDTSVFNPDADPAPWKAELGIKDELVVLSPRALKPLYNHHILIEAIPAIRAAFPATVFVLRDFDAEASYKQTLQQKIKQMGLEESVRWVGRVEPWERLAGLYRAADLVVSIPSSDATPISALEAMACGRPVVLGNLPSARIWVTPGENGSLVPVGDTGALAASMISLLGRPAQRLAFSQAGLDLVHTKADQMKEMKKMENIYRQVFQTYRENKDG